MRYPEKALEYGIDQLASCFDGVTASDVVKTVHLCCGYPCYLVSYYKNNNSYYLILSRYKDLNCQIAIILAITSGFNFDELQD